MANIDLDSSEGRKSYLTEKLNDLIKGINENYGTVLLDELVNRLEITIRDFNDEMNNAFELLNHRVEDALIEFRTDFRASDLAIFVRVELAHIEAL